MVQCVQLYSLPNESKERVRAFLREISATYETLKLGIHTTASPFVLEDSSNMVSTQ